MNSKRIVYHRKGPDKIGPFVYWMSRDQRIDDNWAFIFALQMSQTKNTGITVVFCLTTEFPGANLRSYDFMIKGLQETEQRCLALNIPFYLLTGDPTKAIPAFLKETSASGLVTDLDPVSIKRRWKKTIRESTDISYYEIDAHNIVPCTSASNKAEYGAYTIRPKIKRQLKEFLVPFPKLIPLSTYQNPSVIEWDKISLKFSTDQKVPVLESIIPGTHAAQTTLHEFINKKLKAYALKRNDPTTDATSNLSPYLHFGQISAQSIALKILESCAKDENTESFLEELIIRKSLSDNFCYYNQNYDSFSGFPIWARTTLNEHRNDIREYSYNLNQFESGATHENLWNAAQNELVRKGKMHGYMRMYWAKKILEWSNTPEEALEISIYLNDKYSIDGRDPNGYAGCAWAIGGTHDRAWSERSVFGKIRYMNENGCRRKFDIDQYIQINT